VVWLRPFEKGEGELRIRVQADGRRFVIESGALPGTVHARGEIIQGQSLSMGKKIDLENSLRNATKPLASSIIYERFQQAGMRYGPYFRTIENLWIGTDEV